MNKAEIASYLVSLHTLLDAQSRNSTGTSTTLAQEYEKYWAMFKDEIKKGEDDEARTRTDSSSKPQGRAQESSGQPGRSQSIGPRSGLA